MPITRQSGLAGASTGIFFLLALLLSLGVAGFSYHSVRDFEQHAVWLQHSYAVLNKLEEINATLRETVGNSRSYVVSGQQEYRANFEAGERQVNALLQELHALVSDNPQQVQLLGRTDDLVAQRLAVSRQLMALNPEEGRARVLEGKDLGDRIRSNVELMKGNENTLLATRAKDTAVSANLTIFMVISGSLLSIALLLLVYRKLRREMARRVEAQQRAQAYSDEIEDLYNNAPCGYHSVDESNKIIIKINDTELKWLGYTRDQVVGRMTQADLLAPASAERYQRELYPQFLLKREISGIDLNFRRADGSQFTALVNATAIPSRDQRKLISRTVIYDISERKRAEEEIEALNADLERQAQHLHSVNKELESFSYSVSHDLRAPLRAISGYAMILEEDYAQAIDDKGREQLQVIRRNVRKMDALINDLLKLAKSTTGELTLQRFSMDELVGQVIAGLRQENPGVAFEVAHLEGAVANRGLIAQVWENLLANAVKFSSKSEQPLVRVSMEVSADEYIYGVHDNGVGFDMRYAHKLFGTFQRLHRQEEYAGTGIGLALVQRIVIRHSGRVWAESQPKQGASFYFALPRKHVLPALSEAYRAVH
ncbi:histidine kinase [Herbaspirillum rubrisubalbicans]|uniref:histidine kinase n=2 Tax=Herbaspirillum rubrisubalbicans TaxID=80842 RepID=A0ABX9C7C2_9BURK|nr:CHASE3 domain-containing protein [Herbaspirillum rubrisubalbicans]MCP1572873.1 PAS domain S-box-containing protein [Herbaspirillum rubrisubalbicans]QJQ01440.1 histidine kinase [Herbaspirillum rubrisubalbicans Os34]RAM66832.1 histidine kinase [Herbaspirillum rubrisubalbicans]RAN47491.1 histidine kinase [Herbaspirillum rubrisubalbicans]